MVFVMSGLMISYCFQTWDYGARAVFHGIPDAKSAHIFQMNQATRSKSAPNGKPIPARFQPKFGNFIMPMHKVAERERKLKGVRLFYC